MSNPVLKGLPVYLLKQTLGADTTREGVTSNYERFILVGEGVPEVFEVTENRPGLKLVKRSIGGRPYFHAEPLYTNDNDNPRRGCWHMSGGNYVTSSDSRLSELGIYYPISVHDRVESVLLLKHKTKGDE